MLPLLAGPRFTLGEPDRARRPGREPRVEREDEESTLALDCGGLGPGPDAEVAGSGAVERGVRWFSLSSAGVEAVCFAGEVSGSGRSPSCPAATALFDWEDLGGVRSMLP